MSLKRKSLIGLLSLLCCGGLSASGGTGTYPIDWNGRGEVLNYHSCGCADDCWVAELQDKRTKRVKARLRCDCETLFFYRFASHRENLTLGSCTAINRNEHKSERITETLEKLLANPDSPEVEHIGD